MRRRGFVVLAVAAALVAGLVLLLRGGDGPQRAVADPVAEALARLPRGADLVALVASDGEGRQLRALRDVLGRIPGAGIAVGRLLRGLDAAGLGERARSELSGAPVAVGMAGGLRAGVLAWPTAGAGPLGARIDDAVRAGLLREAAPSGGVRVLRVARPAAAGPVAPVRAVAVRGRLLLAATSEELVRAAARRDDRARARGLRRRLGAAGTDALVRAVGRPRSLLPARVRVLVPELARAREAVLTAGAVDDGLLATLRLDGAVVPLAPGAGAPAPAGLDGDVHAALREPRTSAPAALRALGVDGDVARADALLGRLRRDTLTEVLTDRLTGTATLALSARGGPVAQLQLDDAGPLRDLLGDISRVPDLLLGRAGLDVDEDDGVFAVRLPGAPELRVAVAGDRVGVTTGGDPRPVATRVPAARTTPGAGALSVRVSAAALRSRLPALLGLPRFAQSFLAPLGDLTLGVRRDGRRVVATLVLQVRR
ncbi:MAG TPA: hypothetical protein VD931_05430 [Baekduia sp.]|nr:hypothetical protein [Baekduia sp.]